MKKTTLLLLIILLLGSLFAKAQIKNSDRFINQRTIGGFALTGIPLYRLEDKTRYEPIIGGFLFHQPLYQAKKRMNIAVDLMPQVAFVPFESHNEFEMGFNVNFSFGYEINPTTIFSFNIGSGPHYISSYLTRQAHGFIFSDNFTFALRKKINNLDISIFAGWRHISNAGLEEPNRGINNVSTGFSIAHIISAVK